MRILEGQNIPGHGSDDAEIEKWVKKVSSKDCSLSSKNNASFDFVYNETGIEKKQNIKFSFFSSKDYKNFKDYLLSVNSLFKEDAFLVKNDKKMPISNFFKTFEWIISEAKKAYSIQRYKGLGEMNPDQLWETTMDPENRTLVQITEEDEAAADKVFDDLMGDNVAPRKLFIEENARYAGNIDI